MKKVSVAALALSIIAIMISGVALSISLSRMEYVESMRPKELPLVEREKYKKMAEELSRRNSSGWDFSNPKDRGIYTESEMKKMGIKSMRELTNQTNSSHLYRPSMLNIYNKAHKRK